MLSSDRNQPRRFNPRRAIIITFLALFIIATIFILFHKPETPRVSVTFLSFSNAPPRDFKGVPVGTNFVLFSVTNHSRRLVHCIGFIPSRYSPQVIPLQVETIQPGASQRIIIPPSKGSSAEVDRLYFRRPDTATEEVREMLDSVLRSVGISIPGLNPDPIANIFSAPASIPPEAKPTDH